MNELLIACALFVNGCSTLGEIEALNNSASGKRAGETLRAIDSSCKVLSGHPCTPPVINPGQINQAMGQAAQMPYHLKHGQPAQKAAEIQQMINWYERFRK